MQSKNSHPRGAHFVCMSYRRRHIKPRIRKLKKKKIFFKRPLFWVFLVFLTIIALLYFILFSQKFQTVKIDVLGNEEVKAKDIESIAWQNINKKIDAGIIQISTKSIFIVNKEDLIKDILNEFPNIGEVKVQKELPNNLILKVTERQPFAVFCNNDKCFFIDEKGIIFEQPKDIPDEMVIIRKQSIKTPELRENIIDRNIVNIISKIKHNLKNNFQIGIEEILVSETLVFKTSENWLIYFDPTRDIDLQITKMNALLRDEISEGDRKNLQYIYLQYKDRAYYK